MNRKPNRDTHVNCDCDFEPPFRSCEDCIISMNKWPQVTEISVNEEDY